MPASSAGSSPSLHLLQDAFASVRLIRAHVLHGDRRERQGFANIKTFSDKGPHEQIGWMCFYMASQQSVIK